MKGAFMKKFMKRTIFLSFALSCAAIAQQPSTSTTPSPEQVENAIQRLPAAYRNAANTFLHLENENLAHIASEAIRSG
jgi:tartrate-resistant acid phosphatase type 5